jgi:hypothetical protein
MIGELDIAAAIEEQQELFARVVERVDHKPGDTDSLFDYSGNLGVDFHGLMTIVSDYVRTRPLSFIAPEVVAVKFFLLGIVMGRDHRP